MSVLPSATATATATASATASAPLSIRFADALIFFSCLQIKREKKPLFLGNASHITHFVNTLWEKIAWISWIKDQNECF